MKNCKIVAIVLVLVMLMSSFALFGCDKRSVSIDGETSSVETTEETTTDAETETDTDTETETETETETDTDNFLSDTATGITLDRERVILDNEGTGSFTVTVIPETAVNNEVLVTLDDGDAINVTVGEPEDNAREISLTAKGIAGKYILSVKVADTDITKDLTVYVREATPQIAVSYSAEKLNGLVVGATYKIIGAGVEASSITATGTEIKIDTAWYGKTLNIIRVNSEENCNSGAQVLVVPSRPSAPTVSKTDASSATATDGAITGVSAAMEYQKQGDTAWKSISGTAINGLGAGTYLVRYKSTGSAFASPAATVVIGYGKVVFTDSDTFDVPTGEIGTDYTVNVSGGVKGGKAPYTYSVSGHSWITVDANGKLTADRPNTDQAATTATITVTDADGSTSSITINVGAVFTPHTCVYDKKVNTDTYKKSGATCTAAAVYYYSCFCGAKGSETFTDGSALGHAYTEKIEDAAHLKQEGANCQSKHEYWYDCSRCTASAKNDAAATDKFYNGTLAGDHDFNTSEWGYREADGHAHICKINGCNAHDTVVVHTPGAAATETSPQLCTACSYEIAPVKEHVHTLQTKAAKAATCTESGNILYYYCTGSCGKYFSDAAGAVEITDKSSVEIEAAHDYTEKIEDEAHLKTQSQSCQVHHVYWYDCSRCTASAKNDAAATDKFYNGTGVGTGHNFGTEWKKSAAEHWHECACGAEQGRTAHVNVDGNDVCDTCGYTFALTISDNNINKYKIVYYDSYYAKQCAQELRAMIADLTGVTLEVVSDAADVTAYEILVGKTNRTESKTVRGTYSRPNVYYDVKVVGEKLVVMAEGYATLAAVTEKAEAYFEQHGTAAMTGSIISGNVLSSVDTDNIGTTDRAQGTDLRVFHWNMCGNYIGTASATVYSDNVTRGEVMADIILQFMPDIITTNAFYLGQQKGVFYDTVIKELTEYYNVLNSEYETGKPAASSKPIDKYGAGPTINDQILYKKDLGLTVKWSGWRYGPDGNYARGFHTAVFTTSGGKDFIVSVGLYSDSTTDSKWALAHNAAISDAKTASGVAANTPVVVTGDMYTYANNGNSSYAAGYNYWVAQNYRDSQVSALVNANGNKLHGTLHAIGQVQTADASRDFIWYNNMITSLCFKVIASKNAADTSDHYPVMADLKFNTEPTSLITIAGNNIQHYKIVYYDSVYAKQCAEIIRDIIKEITDYELELVTDSAPVSEYEILVGKTNRTEAVALRRAYSRPNVFYDVKVVGNKLIIMGEGYRTLAKLETEFSSFAKGLAKYTDLRGGLVTGDILAEVDAIDCMTGALTVDTNADIRVLHWNLAAPLSWTQKDTAWADTWPFTANTLGRRQRAEQQADVILIYNPDIITTNEVYIGHANGTQYATLIKELSEYFIVVDSEYDTRDTNLPSGVPKEADNNTAYGNPEAILLRKGKFNIIDSGWRNLSDKDSNGNQIRYHGIHWAVLEIESSGQKFIISGAHYGDARSKTTYPAENLAAIAFAQKCSGSSTTLPVILTGDMFTGVNHSSSYNGTGYRYLVSNGYNDSQVSATLNCNEVNGTLHGTFHDPMNDTNKLRLSEDFVWYNSELKSLKFGVIVTPETTITSDHWPVFSDLKFN